MEQGVKFGLEEPCPRQGVVAHEAGADTPAVGGVVAVLRARRDTTHKIIHPTEHGGFAADPAVNGSKQGIKNVPADPTPKHRGVEDEELMPPTEAEQALGASQRAGVGLAPDVTELEAISSDSGGGGGSTSHEVRTHIGRGYVERPAYRARFEDVGSRGQRFHVRSPSGHPLVRAPGVDDKAEPRFGALGNNSEGANGKRFGTRRVPRADTSDEVLGDDGVDEGLVLGGLKA
jgi:hypothetical protein